MLNNMLNKLKNLDYKRIIKIIAITIFSVFIILFIIGYLDNKGYLGTIKQEENRNTIEEIIKRNTINGKLVVDNNILPKDPGSAGKKTLLGIDSDNDGIRDDVEIAIFEKYPDEPIKRKVLLKEARVDQKKFEAYLKGDRSKILNELYLEESAASECTVKFTKSTRELIKVSDHYQSTFYNTKERLLAQNKIDSYFAGGFFGSSELISDNCIHEE
jgi:hypothetical protein